MSDIAALESALSEVFAEFDVEVEEGTTGADVMQTDIRVIRTDLSVLAGSRPSGN
ncbi:hypothetical protein GCM10020229_32010 [Kitasatospora albolonga]|uniref:hypothetical protein n=1 Tax=Kitasatospora TaxID=2063 RepID=UPI0031F16500